MLRLSLNWPILIVPSVFSSVYLYSTCPCFSIFLDNSIPYQGNPDRNHKLWNIV